MTSNDEILSRAVAGTPDLMTFTFPTNDPREKQSRSHDLRLEMRRILMGRLSPAELSLFCEWERNPNAPITSQQEAKLLDKFDEVLIEQVASLGWRMYECVLVLARIAAWTDSRGQGIEKLKKFSHAIVIFAQVRQGIARAPFTEPEWYLTRKDALREIKYLQGRLYAQFTTRNRPPSTTEEVYSGIRTEVATPGAYEYLASNLTSFLDYLLERDSRDQTVLPLSVAFAMREETPATVLDGWFDYQGNTAAGKSRQIISRARSRKRQ